MIAGFSVGGVDWPIPELEGVTDPVLARQIRRRAAANEAAAGHRMGGNALRGLDTPRVSEGEGTIAISTAIPARASRIRRPPRRPLGANATTSWPARAAASVTPATMPRV